MITAAGDNSYINEQNWIITISLFNPRHRKSQHGKKWTACIYINAIHTDHRLLLSFNGTVGKNMSCLNCSSHPKKQG
jgi:hypothetical protein